MWSLKKLVSVIVDMINNEFDCILFIEGNRGLGKSTLAYQIARKVKREINEKKFNPHKDIMFKREEVMRALAVRKRDVIFADEMINVSFKRDFYLEDQKTLMKMLDMYRDSCNLFIGCVPKFISLDTHLRDLVKIRISVVRRGLAIIHTQKHSMFVNDRWDTVNNERIERKWKERPRYTQLTTFKGLLKFSKLKERSQQIYEEVKHRKRNILFTDPEQAKEKQDMFDKMTDLLVAKKLTKAQLHDYAEVLGLNFEGIRTALRKRLNERGIEKNLKDFFRESEGKIEEETKQKRLANVSNF